ncbi:hypothetical protein PC5_00038 [Campylobacter phage PC5]|uniref:Uncharacterized protein n=1 Tax=Campylobacter phage PC5 TaxID=1541690 RepID=A0A1B0XVQ4_9CAUD|nr:hypothetical protein PC5_00038 [Campylobacter phage PC5]
MKLVDKLKKAYDYKSLELLKDKEWKFYNILFK